MDTWTYQIACLTEPSTLRLMRWLAYHTARAGGAGTEVAGDVLLAMGEVLSNAARHAYPGSAGSLEINYHLTDDRLHIRVQNHGGPITDAIDMPTIRPPLRADGGLGLYILAQLMDDVEIYLNAAGDGVAVRMSVHLT